MGETRLGGAEDVFLLFGFLFVFGTLFLLFDFCFVSAELFEDVVDWSDSCT